MPDAATTDYAAELERIVEALTRGKSPGLFDLLSLRRSAALIRRQAEEVAWLRSVLAEVQWQDIHAAPCFICENPKERGHAPDCRLKAALDCP